VLVVTAVGFGAAGVTAGRTDFSADERGAAPEGSEDATLGDDDAVAVIVTTGVAVAAGVIVGAVLVAFESAVPVTRTVSEERSSPPTSRRAEVEIAK